MTTRIIRILLAASLALWSVTGRGDITNVENAYESDAAHVTLPGSITGRLTLRECAGCKPVVLRVNAQTVYRVGTTNPPVSLRALRTAAAAEGAESRLLTVFYSLESGTVTRVILSDG